MILIFGGAYQGKLNYVLNTYSLERKDVTFCSQSEDFNVDKKIIYKLEDFIFACAKAKIEAIDILKELEESLEDKILIVNDVSQGLVPMDPVEREYREMSGRTLIYLAERADSVIRVFCGLGQKLK